MEDDGWLIGAEAVCGGCVVEHVEDTFHDVDTDREGLLDLLVAEGRLVPLDEADVGEVDLPLLCVSCSATLLDVLDLA